MEIQRNAMLMYTSCGWFFNDISGIETVQVLAYAARTIQLAEAVGGWHALTPRERGELTRLARSQREPAAHVGRPVRAADQVTGRSGSGRGGGGRVVFLVGVEEEVHKAVGRLSRIN